jgi:hypothetical protein
MLQIKVNFRPTPVRKAIEEAVEPQLLAQAVKIVEELKEATPVDTGRARDSWELQPSLKITNSTDYIQFLNAGTSTQASPNFIESILLKFGRAKGAILSYL